MSRAGLDDEWGETTGCPDQATARNVDEKVMSTEKVCTEDWLLDLGKEKTVHNTKSWEQERK